MTSSSGIWIFILIAVTTPFVSMEQFPLEIQDTVDDTNKPSYIIALLVKDKGNLNMTKYCSGGSIKPEWVMTAAHCSGDKSKGVTDMKYKKGVPTSTISRSKVIEVIEHPEYEDSQEQNNDKEKNNLGLLRTEPPISLFGKLKAVNPNTLLGLGVHYASVGKNNNKKVLSNPRVFTGKDVTASCLHDAINSKGLICSVPKHACYVPKMSNNQKKPLNGDRVKGLLDILLQDNRVKELLGQYLQDNNVAATAGDPLLYNNQVQRLLGGQFLPRKRVKGLSGSPILHENSIAGLLKGSDYGDNYIVEASGDPLLYNNVVGNYISKTPAYHLINENIF